MSDISGGSPQVAQPAPSPGYPTNPAPIAYEGFTGLNTKAAQQGIGDQEMFVCDGFMPLGVNNLRSLPDVGTAIYTATGGKTIKRFGFGNIGALPICIVWLSDGSLEQVNLNTNAVTTIGGPNTVTRLALDFSQWSSLYSIIVANQTNGYWLWDGTNLFTAGTVSPVVTITNGGSGYASAPTITAANVGAPATGYIEWAVNPVNGETITLNGLVWTFVTGSPGAHQTQIQGSAEFTIFQLQNNLNAAADSQLTVATYLQSGAVPNVRINVTYDTAGTVGNAYTLAASIATPSAATLTNGADGGFGATFVGTVSNGSLVSVTVSNPGSGFSGTDSVILTITGGGSDDMASATASISADSGISSVIVNNGGVGYSSLVQITASSAGQSVEPQFTVLGQNGVITQVVVNNPGLGFTSVPTLTVTDLASGATGAGALVTAVLTAGQIASVTVTGDGTGYTSPPTLTVLGDGVGAQLQANMSLTTVGSIDVINPGVGYTKAVISFEGGNRGAAATVFPMPYGVSGTTVETYSSRVWVGNGRVGQHSATADPSDFSAFDGAGGFQSTDSFLKIAYHRFIQSNGFLYLFGDSSINYISGVTTSGNPAETTFNNLNVDPQIGTPWLGTVQAFGRDIVFANSIGVYVSYGGAVTKVSDMLDGIYATVPQANWPVGFEPTAAVMTIFGIQVYILLMQIIDQVTGDQVTKCLMWDGKKWWTSPQTGMTIGIAATQEVNSVLTAYCSPEALTIKPMFNTANTLFTKYLYSKLWSNPGIFTTKMTRELFTLLNVNVSSVGIVATGYIRFASNPSNGDTATLNGVVWTFVSGTAIGNQVHIQGTVELTMVFFQNALLASIDPLLTVATYFAETAGPVQIEITYNEAGTVGNAYTLAASVATPSGAHLTGGVDPDIFYLAPITESGVGAEASYTLTETGAKILGPTASAEAGRIIGVRVRTTAADIQINAITPFNQVMQSDV